MSLHTFNTIIVVLMTALYFYQVIYMIIGYAKRDVPPTKEASKNHRYAAFISARNEAAVIGELIDTLKKQEYPEELFDVYVLADNCTDNTAQVSRDHGAIVYERFNKELVGKGYALDYLYKNVIALKGEDYYDAFMVFDADNIVDKNFVKEMNKTFDTGKYDALTSYRNSKNFGSSWLSAAYSIWFLREARYVNYPRSILGTSCMISGTGFLVSSKVMKENGGWPYHLLTEDIQFSVNCALDGYMIGYCDGAMVYDEQPTTWATSWTQRLRWSKGFYQIDFKYVGSLIKGSFTSKHSRMSCYDMLMTVLPATLLTIFVFVLNGYLLYASLTMPYYYRIVYKAVALRYMMFGLINYYIGMLIVGGMVILTEWDRIPATKSEKLKYLWIFPLFIASYIPISIKALFATVEWQPIEHHATSSLTGNN